MRQPRCCSWPAQPAAVAAKIAKLPLDVLRLNKRAIHRQMEAMGLRNGIRAGTGMVAAAIEDLGRL